MDIRRMLSSLTAERHRLDQAISALQGLDSAGSIGTARRGRPPAGATGTQPGRRRRMSAEARAKIAAAARARWARQKGTAPKEGAAGRKTASAPAKRGRKGGISAAGRKKLSQMMKARWAARKKAAKA